MKSLNPLGSRQEKAIDKTIVSGKGVAVVLVQVAITAFFVLGLTWFLGFFADPILAFAISALFGYGLWFFLDRNVWVSDPTIIETAHPNIEFEYIGGGRLLSQKEIEQKQGRVKRTGRYLEAGAFVVPQDDEVKGFSYVGAPGSGKTLNIRLHMQSTLLKIGKKADHRALIYDAKGDMPQILSGMGFEVGTKQSKVKVLHPYDVRSVRWAMWKDIDEPKIVNEIATLLIPAQDSKDPIWEQLARALLEGVLQTFIATGKPWTLRDVCCAMRSIDRLRSLFELSSTTESLIQKLLEGGKSTKSIEMTIYAYMKPLEFIASVWEHTEEEVSFYEWLNVEESILVLGHDGVDGSALERLNQIIVLRLAQLVHQQSNSDTRRTWLYFDELRQAGFLNLTPFATFGRSRGVCLVLGFQDMEGLEHKYEEKVARELLGMCQHQAYFALATSGTAQWASEQFGKQQLLWRSTSRNEGRDSTSEQIQEQPVVKPEEFLYSESFTKGASHKGFYRSISTGAYCKHLAPTVFDKPSLLPLDKTVSCSAIKGESLRGKEEQELKDWSKEELEKWGIRKEKESVKAETPVSIAQSQEHLPKLLREKRGVPIPREQILIAIQSAERRP